MDSSTPVSIDVARRVLDPSLLELTLMPTERCNFRCSYCYEDFVSGKMSSSTVAAVNALLARRADGNADLFLKWFGGEPLMASDIVLDLSKRARNLWQACGRQYSSHMTTNAYYLDREMFERLLDVEVREFQVTLDGPELVHNGSRKKSNGDGTFSTIWGNLLNVARYGKDNTSEEFLITLRVHYDGKTAHLLKPLLEDIVKDLGTERFAVNLHPIEDLGGNTEFSIAQLDERGISALAEYEQFLVESGMRTVLAMNVSGYVCYAARANSFVIRSDGHLAKCTVALRDPHNDIGKLLSDGRLEIARDKWIPWIRGVFSGDPSELACPNRGLASNEVRKGQPGELHRTLPIVRG